MKAAVACLVGLVLFVVAESSVIPAYRGAYYFFGDYHGSCAGGQDGMYYYGADSFVVCTNGNSYVQPCAPGTANGPSRGYKVGSYYSQGDFCNINLNDYNGHHGYHHNGYFPYAGYGFPYGYGW